MRRALGVLVMLFTLHVLVTSAGLGCAQHHGAHAARETMAGMTHAAHSTHAPAGDAPARDCNQPVSPDCCPAVTSCSTVMVAVATGRLASPAGREVVRERVAATLVSHVAAPGTPPPRA